MLWAFTHGTCRAHNHGLERADGAEQERVGGRIRRWAGAAIPIDSHTRRLLAVAFSLRQPWPGRPVADLP